MSDIMEEMRDLLSQQEISQRHSYFQLKYFLIGKEPTYQSKMWQCLRELRNRVESLDNMSLEIDELKDKIDEKIEFLNDYKSIHIRHTDIKNESLLWVQEFLKQNQNSNIYMATDNPRLLDIYKKWHPKIFNFTKSEI